VSVATLLLRKSIRFPDEKTLDSQKKYITKSNLHTAKMPKKCIAVPTIDNVQLIANQRQRKREIAATLGFVCTRGVRTQVFSSPTPVLIQEVGILILIRILFATQI